MCAILHTSVWHWSSATRKRTLLQQWKKKMSHTRRQLSRGIARAQRHMTSSTQQKMLFAHLLRLLDIAPLQPKHSAASCSCSGKVVHSWLQHLAAQAQHSTLLQPTWRCQPAELALLCSFM